MANEQMEVTLARLRAAPDMPDWLPPYLHNLFTATWGEMAQDHDPNRILELVRGSENLGGCFGWHDPAIDSKH